VLIGEAVAGRPKIIQSGRSKRFHLGICRTPRQWNPDWRRVDELVLNEIVVEHGAKESLQLFYPFHPKLEFAFGWERMQDCFMNGEAQINPGLHHPHRLFKSSFYVETGTGAERVA
jgi:hypothetical protein